MVDPFGRHITYLRVSVTDRCDFRCIYCMAETMTFLPRQDVLTLEEIDRLASAFIAKGVRKLRLTGGEPLVRRNIMWLFERLSRHLGGGLDELTLTTNGSQLALHAEALAACGVKRINVSLDTLDSAKFRAITRRGDLSQVMQGIDAAERAGRKMPRQRGEQRHDAAAHQRFAAGQPELAHALGHERAAQPVELLERQEVGLRQKRHVLGHAIDAAEVAAVGHRHPQIGDGAGERVDQRRRPAGGAVEFQRGCGNGHVVPWGTAPSLTDRGPSVQACYCCYI